MAKTKKKDRLKTKDHLSEEEIEKVLLYITYLADVMRLRDWQIYLAEHTTEDDEDDGAYATMEGHEHRQAGKLVLTTAWERFTTDRKTLTLIHELTHLFHKRLVATYLTGLESGHIPQILVDQTDELATLELEEMVDHISLVIMPFVEPFPGPATSISPMVTFGKHDL